MRARNRELFGLLPVSLLVTAGFTAVLITRSKDINKVTITYGLIFLGACLFAHLFIRSRLPDADPYMFPLRAANLAGLPATVLMTAEFDPLRDEGYAYARELSKALEKDKEPEKARMVAEKMTK